MVSARSEPSAETGLGAAFDFIQSMAVLPVDPDADAEFARFKKTLVKSVPRRVIQRTKKPAGVE
jgi:hypothetical protein